MTSGHHGVDLAGHENPNVVEAYNKYRKSKFKTERGFEIISVSLDRDKAPWIKAIEDDGLIWKNHGWDNKGVVSNCMVYAPFLQRSLLMAMGK